VVCLLIGAAFLYADHGLKKKGYDLYWKNKIALADNDAMVIDSLVPYFLEAAESFPTDSMTGELVTGSDRRCYSDDHLIGWILKIVDKVEVKSEDGEMRKFYRIEKHLVFDLRTGENRG